ncbi:MAG: hypothetical protein AVDCRST_MAG60-528, partial [uncultured Nocardioides sp.]
EHRVDPRAPDRRSLHRARPGWCRELLRLGQSGRAQPSGPRPGLRRIRAGFGRRGRPVVGLRGDRLGQRPVVRWPRRRARLPGRARLLVAAVLGAPSGPARRTDPGRV